MDGKYLRATAVAPTPGRGHETDVRAGGCACVAFVGAVQDGSGPLQPMPGFEILAGGGYKHQDGVRGKIAFNTTEQLITFYGWGIGQAALYSMNGKSGRSEIHILNERRSRAVIDCDGPLR